MKPKFFPRFEDFYTWLSSHHASEKELLVGFYKRDSGKPSITWPESVDAALCFGWIDGVRRSRDEVSYTIRFTPRSPRSNWSLINCKKIEVLKKRGLMRPEGLRAFAARSAERTGLASFERKEPAVLDAAQEGKMRANEKAWKFFAAQPPWYQRAATHWVISAKRAETRERRLATLIEDSANGRTVAPLTRPAK